MLVINVDMRGRDETETRIMGPTEIFAGMGVSPRKVLHMKTKEAKRPPQGEKAPNKEKKWQNSLP